MLEFRRQLFLFESTTVSNTTSRVRNHFVSKAIKLDRNQLISSTNRVNLECDTAANNKLLIQTPYSYLNDLRIRVAIFEILKVQIRPHVLETDLILNIISRIQIFGVSIATIRLRVRN